MDGCLSDPRKIIEKLDAKWGFSSAQQLRRVLVDSDGDNMHVLTCVDGVLERCDKCRPLDKAPHVPVAGTSTVFRFNEKSREDLLFSGDIIALRAMDVSSQYSLSKPARSKNPQEVWNSFRNSRGGVFGQPRSIQVDEGGGRKNEVRTDLRSDRRTKLQFQGVRAHPCVLGRLNGLAQGNYNRAVADDRFSGSPILAEVRRRLNAVVPGGG